MSSILQNKILIITVITWCTAQVIKIILNYFHQQKLDWHWFFQTGGMPSSHSAGAAALATACGFKAGFESIDFAIAGVFAMVTMFDAQGIRRSAGRQAKLLNSMRTYMKLEGDIPNDTLKELVGHTPLQVLAGGILGILMACLFYT